MLTSRPVGKKKTKQNLQKLAEFLAFLDICWDDIVPTIKKRRLK